VTTLLVANDGGHLMQLHTLRPRLGVGDDVVWVTPRTPQTESLLAGERVHWAQPCPPRDTRALARNAMACRVLFTDHDVSLVVSTGAALALAVLPQARLRGIETVHIESATRLDAPSLSGRALAMVPGITTFSQSSALARGHWQFLASPWELYETAPAAERPVRSMVVSLGTQDGYGFRRLLDRLVPLVPADAEVLWQTGGTDATGLGIDARERVPSEEMAAAIRAADVVVAHAGTVHRADGAGERQVPDPGAPPRDARRARRRPPADDRARARAARPVHLPRRRQPQGARPRGRRGPHGHQGRRPAPAAHQRGADPAPASAYGVGRGGRSLTRIEIGDIASRAAHSGCRANRIRTVARGGAP
jgi:hypothetical protein